MYKKVMLKSLKKITVIRHALFLTSQIGKAKTNERIKIWFS